MQRRRHIVQHEEIEVVAIGDVVSIFDTSVPSGSVPNATILPVGQLVGSGFIFLEIECNRFSMPNPS